MSDEYVLIFSLVHVIHLLKNGILVEDVIITPLTNLILCIICSTHEGMVSYGIYLFKIEQTYILNLYKRVAVAGSVIASEPESMFFFVGILILNEYHFIENIFTIKLCFPLYIYSKDTIVPDLRL